MARDYRAEYTRRMELGRERGIEPEAARGHRGPAALGAAIEAGTVRDVLPIPGRRDEKGRIETVTVVVRGADGKDRAYTVPYSQGRRLARKLDLSGIPYEPRYGLKGPS